MKNGRKWALAYAVYAVIVGGIFTFVNAPFQVPDEVGHYWRAAALAAGSWAPAARDASPEAKVPGGVRDLVGSTWVETAGKEDGTVGNARLRAARALELRRDRPATVRFPSFYTPVPYLPQAAALWTGFQLDARPLTTFYAARLANLFVMVGLVAAAMLIAPGAAWIFAAAGSLPMTLHLAGSFSPDAFTFGAATVALALALTAERLSPMRYVALIAAAAFVLALCKPVYFLIPAVALWNRNVNRRAVVATAVAVALIAGLAVSGWVARRGTYNMRGSANVDPGRQLSHVLTKPLSVAGVVIADYRANHTRYRHELVGRLGWLDVPLPIALSTFAQLAFVVAALTASRLATGPQRASAAVVFVATLFIVALSQYIVWTPVASGAIEGIQGRYFIPIVALLAVAIQLFDNRRLHEAAITLLFGAIVVLDAFGIYRVATRYW